MASFSQTLVHHFLENSARTLPGKTALIHDDLRAGYGGINAMANSLANWLIGRGIEPGDRIVILLENGLEYVAAYYGILKSGAVAVPLGTEMKQDGIALLLAALEPKVLISSKKHERTLREIDLPSFGLEAVIICKPEGSWSSTPFAVVSWDELAHDVNTADPGIALPEDALCSIIYTSGSTGVPKGVMLTHRNVVANTRSIVEYLRLERSDIQMVVLPFFYVMGKSLLNTHFAAGGTVVINNRFAYPASVVEQMSRERVTGFSGVPSTFAYLLHRSPLKQFRGRLESLRYCSQAGGHMSRHVKEELLKVLPEHTALYVMYGATEASARLTYVEPCRLKDKIESIGRPIPGVSMRILDSRGRELPAGEVGELVAWGENIMQGYWRDPEGTRDALDGNGYHTGDIGFQDDEGYYFLVGRKDSLLKVGGHRVNPQEVEDALMATGMLVEVAVVGVPDELLGNRLVACGVPKDKDCTANQILGECAGRVPRFKLPGEMRLLRSLPKSSNGKVDRQRCRELASGCTELFGKRQ